ncbi:adenosylmethionine-8-amino-7-oxononanoate aminotransferase [Fontimonas thermophila]|uniref:Adenosylmethionine-8-amino-7-oxononanoate aminotransferase n=1 Tax=Fontimonas thermophila TaxID=1076937 RepID=A0A1I2IFS9_9GAMM|nr:adenosylmethionine--8-amino-7-oxononanoate transaminase [Fontimonas thermophila]SFF39696.1 adenosylmethionine-8-amino-7-oxononanoate aminotransferase [Fontimonas thermophila]
MSLNDALKQRSLAHVWHPCTQMRDHAGANPELPLIPIRSAEGVWLTDFDGRRYLDAISSWWTNIFGHRHPAIVAALKQQLDTLDHVLLAGFTHEPAVELAERLVKLAPPGLTRCFYADNGSSAIEVALKMSFHYWRNSGCTRKTRFIALTNSYHGETLGALAMGGPSIYRDTYAPLLLQPIYVPSPDCYERAPGQSWEDYTRQRFRLMEETLARHADEVCAVIIEPLVQCAGGMRMYHPLYLRLLREACTRHRVHLIADEIAVGFGRTGRMWGCDWAPPDPRATDAQPGITPDFMCISKGLTGGTLPLAATLTRDEIYDAFYADYREGKAFLHSHSYTGNPIACRAALATLDLFESEQPLAQNRLLAELMWRQTAELRALAHVAEVRQQGMILAIEMARNARSKEPYPASERRGLRAYRHALSAHPDFGVLLRPLGNVIYFMPPYVITPREIEQLCTIALAAVREATRD